MDTHRDELDPGCEPLPTPEEARKINERLMRRGPPVYGPDYRVFLTPNTTDDVSHPAHYNQGGVEAIDAIKAALGEEGFLAFCHGSALKYLLRAKYKDDYAKDLNKATVYIQWALGEDPREVQDPTGERTR